MIINHGGISGGKDSVAMMLWMVYESGLPPETLRFTFCDHGNDAEETYAHVQMISEKVFPVEIIKPERDFWELARHKKRFPSACARFCTQLLKMKPTQDYIDALQTEGHDVRMYCGVRAAESDDRAKLPEWEPANANSNYFSAPLYRPLLSWTIDQVWAIHAKYGIPPNPLYAMGCKRVGCLPCVMSRKREIGIIAQQKPERLQMILKHEQTIPAPAGYASMFHVSTVPKRYRTVPITTKAGKQMNVASINDVAVWALNNPDLYTDEFDFFDEAPPACDSRYGACE